MRLVALAVIATTIAVCSGVDNWWKTASIYQIYPRSFKDSNGDGIGDLNGIREKLPYLQETGFDAIWLSPIYLSPMYDFGYDITDYRAIAPEYGTMKDFDDLMAEAKRRGIRIVLDYVPNHTSNESEWFVKSARREPGFEDYYIWADGTQDEQGNLQPPNNWVSIFRKSAWEYNADRGQYYLHQFVIGQPDLNYRSARVRQEMKDVLSFWLEKGVSGFRVDAINVMYEVNADDFNGRYPDEPLSGDANAGPDDYDFLDHIYTKDMAETYDVVYSWRDLLETFTAQDGESKVMMTEAYTDLPLMIKYYGNENNDGSVPFNFLYLDQLSSRTNARDMKLVIDKWMTYMPNGKTANWVNGNHDQSRMATRHGVDRVDAMNMLSLVLPGITITYQGEELGMTDGFVSWEDTKDPQACNTDDPVNYWKKSRDPTRTPYQWDDSANAGFSNTSGSTWLPVADNYQTVNLDAQMKARNSHYKFYKDVVAIKKTPAVQHGDLDTRALTENVLAVTRMIPHKSAVVALMNLGDTEEVVDLSNFKLLPTVLRVAASGVDCYVRKGDFQTKDSILLTPHCAIVLRSIKPCC